MGRDGIHLTKRGKSNFENRLANVVRAALNLTGEGDDGPQPSMEVVGWVGKQRLQGDVDNRC